MKRVLLTGMSGTGKSTVILELAARGYKAVDADAEGFSEWVETDGNPTGAREGKDWRWREDKVQELLDTEDAAVLFVSGCAENMGKFFSRFDHIILLSAPPDVIVERLEARGNNPYGKRPEEVAQVLHNLQTIEPRLRRVAGHEIDTSAPLDEVIGKIQRALAPHRPGQRRVIGNVFFHVRSSR
jgi:dephospho-CoA kinase